MSPWHTPFHISSAGSGFGTNTVSPTLKLPTSPYTRGTCNRFIAVVVVVVVVACSSPPPKIRAHADSRKLLRVCGNVGAHSPALGALKLLVLLTHQNNNANTHARMYGKEIQRAVSITEGRARSKLTIR